MDKKSAISKKQNVDELSLLCIITAILYASDRWILEDAIDQAAFLIDDVKKREERNG